MTQHEAHRSRWFLWMQGAWISGVAVALCMYVAGLAVSYSQWRQVCTAPAAQCAEFAYATPAGVAQLAERGIALELYALLQVGILLLYQLLPIALGFVIFARKRREPVALLVSFFLITFGTITVTNALAATFPIFQWPAQILNWLATISLPLLLGFFPNGRMVPQFYWAIVIYFGAGSLLSATIGIANLNGSLGSFWTWTGWLAVIFGGVAAQIYRYVRVSTPGERQQTRWVLFGMGAMATVVFCLLAFVAIAGDFAIGTPADPDLIRRLVFLSVLNLAFEFVYLSIGLAILRSKLFDIDIIIRKTLLYTATTVLLALVFFGSVILLQRVFEAVTGQQSQLAIVLSTLAIAALFNPLRNRIQAGIDRRFYRKKYDAQQVLAQFAITARDETDMNALTAELARVVQEAMEPVMVRVWLRISVDRMQSNEAQLSGRSQEH